jgi:hypothetical protein
MAPNKRGCPTSRSKSPTSTKSLTPISTVATVVPYNSQTAKTNQIRRVAIKKTRKRSRSRSKSPRSKSPIKRNNKTKNEKESKRKRSRSRSPHSTHGMVLDNKFKKVPKSISDKIRHGTQIYPITDHIYGITNKKLNIVRILPNLK